MELYMYSCKLKCYNIVNTLLKCVCGGGGEGSGEDFGGGGHKHTSQQKYIQVHVFILHKPLHLCQQY